MAFVAQVVRVPVQQQLTAEQLEQSHQKTQESIERTRGVDGWMGTTVLGSAGVPTLAVSFWRDEEATKANLNERDIARYQQAGLIDQTEVHEVLAGATPSGGAPAKGAPTPTLAQLFKLPADNNPKQRPAEELEQLAKVAQAALDRQVAVDGCEGAVILGTAGVSTMALTFWRDEAAMKAAADYQASEIADAQQATPSMSNIGKPEVLEVIASSRP